MKTKWKATLFGAGFSAALCVLIILVQTIRGYFYRSPVAHLFDFGAYIWWQTNGIIEPLTVAKIIALCLALVFPVLTAYTTGLFLERKNKIAAIIILIAGIVVWVVIFQQLNVSMVHEEGLIHH